MAESNLSLQEWGGSGHQTIAKSNGSPYPGKTQKVTYSGIAARNSVNLVTNSYVRIVSTTDCFVRQGTSTVTAVADVDMFLPASTPYVVRMGQAEDGTKFTRISAVQFSSGGSLFITPMEAIQSAPTPHNKDRYGINTISVADAVVAVKL